MLFTVTTNQPTANTMSFLRDLFRAIKTRWKEITGQRAPRPRLGCIEVEIYALPQDDDDIEFCREVEAFYAAKRSGAELTTAQVDYWADRYNSKQIGRDGTTFTQYLEDPIIVEALRTASQPTPSHSNPTHS